MSKGNLFVVSAPSGCGKGTILAEVLKNKKFYYSVSATTRNPRKGEVDGVNYNFLTKEQFNSLIQNDGLLEYAEYCGNYYGTPKKMVMDKLELGMNVILEIEVNGAMNVKKNYSDAILIFILPPSSAELERRLRKRGTETEEIIQNRISKAFEEIPYAENYDYVIVNGKLEKAVEDFMAIISAEEHKTKNNKNILNKIMFK